MRSPTPEIALNIPHKSTPKALTAVVPLINHHKYDAWFDFAHIFSAYDAFAQNLLIRLPVHSSAAKPVQNSILHSEIGIRCADVDPVAVFFDWRSYLAFSSDSKNSRSSFSIAIILSSIRCE